MLFVCLILVSPHNCQLTSPFPKRSLLVSQQHSLCLSSESSGLSACQFVGRNFPGCARVIQINRRASDICLPVSSCSEHTCVPACRLVVFMHVRRSTAQTLRSFSTHFSVGSGSSVFSLLFPSNEVSAIPKQQTYRVTDLSHGSTSSVIWSGMFTLFPTHLGVWICKICIPVPCANMWQETSQTDVSVLKRVLKKNIHTINGKL